MSNPSSRRRAVPKGKSAPKKASTKKTTKEASTKKSKARKTTTKNATAKNKATSRTTSESGAKVEARRGDLIVIPSQRVGSPPRKGEVLRIIHGEVSVSYEVRWADGHQTLLSPGVGNITIVQPGPPGA
jgi:Domain of unknown function (DUF1918)